MNKMKRDMKTPYEAPLAEAFSVAIERSFLEGSTGTTLPIYDEEDEL